MSSDIKNKLKKKRTVSYLNKDFDGFRSDLLSYARTFFPEQIDDFSESGLGGMFIDMLAYVGDSMSFYLDHHFSLELWENWIDSTKAMIDTSAFYDIYRTLDYGFTFDDFTNSYSVNSYNNQHVKNGLKEFIIERVSALENQIDYLNAEPLIF